MQCNPCWIIELPHPFLETFTNWSTRSDAKFSLKRLTVIQDLDKLQSVPLRTLLENSPRQQHTNNCNDRSSNDHPPTSKGYPHHHYIIQFFHNGFLVIFPERLFRNWNIENSTQWRPVVLNVEEMQSIWWTCTFKLIDVLLYVFYLS